MATVVGLTAVVAVLITLGVVAATGGAGLVHPQATPTGTGYQFVRIGTINLGFVYNSTHHFMSAPFGACATVDCPFELPDSGLNGMPDIGSIEFYVFNSDPSNWTHESVVVANVSSSPAGVSQNGAGYVPVDPDAISFGALVAVKFVPTSASYTVNVTLEGDWM